MTMLLQGAFSHRLWSCKMQSSFGSTMSKSAWIHTEARVCLSMDSLLLLGLCSLLWHLPTGGLL